MANLAERFAATRRGLAVKVQDVRASLETLDHPDAKEHPLDD